MDILLLTLSAICLIVGLLGCVLPILPGLPISYIGLLCLHFSDAAEFSTTFLIVWLVVVIVLQVLDNLLPSWGAKRFGGSKWGIWGSIAGLIVGMTMGPVGIFIGPFVGAIAGELIAGKETIEALKAGAGTFAGLLVGTIAKLIVSGMFIYYFIIEMVQLIKHNLSL